MSNSITQRDLSPIIGQPEEHEGTNSLRIPPSQQQQSKLTPISNRLERLQEGSAIKNAQRQARVLQATEEFLEWPPHTQDAANPNGEDATKLKFLLCPFLPSDFDDAIQERNIAGRCGYMLCPKPNRKQPLKARYRLVIGKELIIVPKEELERWCSDECAERALYLRVQLSEYSLGERYTRDGTVFKLFNEGTQGEESEDHLHHAVEELAKGLGQLAVERGDRKLFDTNLVKGVIKERATTENTPIPPIFEQSYDSDFRRDISGRGQLTEHMEDGEIAKIIEVLPRPIRSGDRTLEALPKPLAEVFQECFCGLVCAPRSVNCEPYTPHPKQPDISQANGRWTTDMPFRSKNINLQQEDEDVLDNI